MPKLLLHLLRALGRPALVGMVLAVLLTLALRSYPRLEPVRESGEVLIAGLTGFWTAHWRRHGSWRFVVVAGLVAALLVALVQLGLMLSLGETFVEPAGLTLARAALAGAMGSGVARLLHQRVVL